MKYLSTNSCQKCYQKSKKYSERLLALVCIFSWLHITSIVTEEREWDESFEDEYYYIWSSQKCLAKNRQLNRLKIQQPYLKAAEPSSAAHVVLLLVWSGSGNKGNSMLGWLAGCPDIIRFLSGVKINGWGSILTTTFYPLSDCDSEQQFKVCWI